MEDPKPTNHLDTLEKVQAEALQALKAVEDESALGRLRVALLGRSSPLMQTFSQLPAVPKEQRPAVGQRANQVKQVLEAAMAARMEEMKAAALRKSLTSQKLDVTLPGRKPVIGRLHPSTQVLRELCRIFGDMGFQVYRSREVETDEYNFQLLNFPPNHPARDMQDTFFVDTGTDRGENPLLLQTHTSPGRDPRHARIRCHRPGQPARDPHRGAGNVLPLRAGDPRSEMQFNQIEGLAVGENMSRWRT